MVLIAPLLVGDQQDSLHCGAGDPVVSGTPYSTKRPLMAPSSHIRQGLAVLGMKLGPFCMQSLHPMYLAISLSPRITLS